MSQFPFLSYNTIEMYLPLIKKHKVSVQARKPNQFLDIYKRHGVQLPPAWQIKRNNFIKRHVVAYHHNPSFRRRLALITWAYDPSDL